MRVPSVAEHSSCAVAVLEGNDNYGIALRSARTDAGLTSWLGSDSIPCGLHPGCLAMLSISPEI